MVRLGDVCTIVMGQAPAGESYNTDKEGLPLIAGAGDFKGNRLTPKKFTTQPTKVSTPGDIVLSIRASIGAKVWSDAEYCLGRGVAGLRARSQIYRRYLWHWLTHSERALAAKGRGATFLQVSRNDIAEMQIELPSFAEQRRIAGILDQADAICDKRRQALANLDALTQSMFHDMFGDARTMFTRWPVESLEDRLEFLTSGSRGWAKYYADSGDKFLRIQNVRSDFLALEDLAYVNPPMTAEARRTAVQPGDVLLSITADLGRTAVIPGDIGTAFINQHLAILRTPSLCSRFLSAFLASPAGQRQIVAKNRAAVKAGLNFDDIRSLQIPVPPEENQRRFAACAEWVDAQRALVQRALDADNELFASLQSRAFRGEL